MISLDSHSAKDDNIALVAPQPPLEGRTTLIPCESSSLTHTHLPLHVPGSLSSPSHLCISTTPPVSSFNALVPHPVLFPPFPSPFRLTLCVDLSLSSLLQQQLAPLLLSTIMDDDGRQSQRQTVLLMRVTRMMWLVVCSGAGDLQMNEEPARIAHSRFQPYFLSCSCHAIHTVATDTVVATDAAAAAVSGAAAPPAAAAFATSSTSSLRLLCCLVSVWLSVIRACIACSLRPVSSVQRPVP